MPTYNPGRREGQTIAFLTDMHSGIDTQTHYMHARVGTDMDWLEKYCKAIGLAGDNVNWNNLSPAAEDAAIKAFIAGRKNKAKYLATSGNHDLASANSSIKHPNRTATAWASATSVPKHSHYPPGETVDSGIQIVALSQESMRFNEWLNPKAAAADDRPTVKPGRGVVYSTEALNYLKVRLNTGRPTILMIHYPLSQHIKNDRFWNPEAAGALTDVLTQYDNVVAVISGHYHATMDRSYLTNRTAVTGNGRTLYIAGVNGPPAGAAVAGVPNYMDTPLIATVVTYAPGKVIVRWRDLAQRRWIPRIISGNKFYYTEISVSCQVPVTL